MTQPSVTETQTNAHGTSQTIDGNIHCISDNWNPVSPFLAHT